MNRLLPIPNTSPLALSSLVKALVGFASVAALAATVEAAPPPRVRSVPPTSPALSPSEALKTFVLPPGYRLELVTSEPLVEDPVWIDMDADGRLYVVEMRGFMPNAAGEGERDPVGRVVVLEDLDDDGRADRSTVFLDGLVLPRSVKVLDRGVLVVEPPHLWLARDVDGDLKADVKEEVTGDFGRADGNPEHNANGLLWGLDNWLHTSEHDALFRFEKGRWARHSTLLRGQWGVTMDDLGRVYRNWNEVPLFVDLVPARALHRNPNLVRTRGVYESLTDDRRIWPVRPTPGVNRGYREGILRPDGSVSVFVAAGSPVVYRGDRLPAELLGNVFVSEPGGNLVQRLLVSEDPRGGLSARNPHPDGDFLASTDERFRPVNFLSAADGTLYVVDMYRGIIQHGAYQSEYLKNHIRAHALDRPIRQGRIYRLVHETTRRAPRPALSRAPAAELVERLAHPNGWHRDTAQRLLVERREAAAAPALRALASAPGREPRVRLHALWTLEGLEALTPADVAGALTDPSPHLRANAVRLSEPWLRERGHSLHVEVLKRIDDPHPAVIRQLAASLGELADDAREPALARLLDRHSSDPVVVDAAVSGLRGREAAVLDRLLKEPGTGDRLSDALAMLAGAAVKQGGDGRRLVLAWATEASRAESQRLALLRGFDAVLHPGAAPEPALPRRGVRVVLDERPAALVAAADPDGGEFARLAARVAADLDWPGKPDAGGIAAPLNAFEQERFAAGERLYGSLCAACHRGDGQGQQGMGPALLGSRWVLGRAGLFARIVIGGKEGASLMPPLPTLTDEQVAAVLTYVRRAWGHTAGAVGEDLVREVRGASTGRTRPWTEADLTRVTQPDGPPRAEP